MLARSLLGVRRMETSAHCMLKKLYKLQQKRTTVFLQSSGHNNINLVDYGARAVWQGHTVFIDLHLKNDVFKYIIKDASF